MMNYKYVTAKTQLQKTAQIFNGTANAVLLNQLLVLPDSIGWPVGSLAKMAEWLPCL